MAVVTHTTQSLTSERTLSSQAYRNTNPHEHPLFTLNRFDCCTATSDTTRPHLHATDTTSQSHHVTTSTHHTNPHTEQPYVFSRRGLDGRSGAALEAIEVDEARGDPMRGAGESRCPTPRPGSARGDARGGVDRRADPLWPRADAGAGTPPFSASPRCAGICSLGGNPPRGAGSASPAKGAALGAKAAASLLALEAALGAGAGGTYEARALTGAGASSSRSMSRVLRRSMRGVDPRGELVRLALVACVLPGVLPRGDESGSELRPRGLASRRAEFGIPRAESLCISAAFFKNT